MGGWGGRCPRGSGRRGEGRWLGGCSGDCLLVGPCSPWGSEQPGSASPPFALQSVVSGPIPSSPPQCQPSPPPPPLSTDSPPPTLESSTSKPGYRLSGAHRVCIVLVRL